MTRTVGFSVVAAAVSAAAAQPSADPFITPDFRGDANTGYWEWDSFADPIRAADGISGYAFDYDAAPDVANPGTNPTALGAPVVRETSGGSFITSTGNAYGSDGGLLFEVVIPTLTTTEDQLVIFQLRALGAAFDFNTVTLNGLSPFDIVLTEDRTDDFPGQGSFSQRSAAVYFLLDAGTLAGSDTFTINFASGDGVMSMDRVAVDTVVPTPGVLTLGAAAGVVALRRRRRA